MKAHLSSLCIMAFVLFYFVLSCLVVLSEACSFLMKDRKRVDVERKGELREEEGGETVIRYIL